MVSISIWHNLSSEKLRNERLDKYSQLRKTWRASLKRFEAADDVGQARLRFERSWLYQVVLDFIGLLYNSVDDVEEQQRRFIYSKKLGGLVHGS